MRAFVTSSRDQDWGHVVAAAHLAHDAEPIHPRQHEVQHQQVVMLAFGNGDAIGASLGTVHRKATTFAKGGRDVIRKPNFIFDNKHSHT
jgi:hypothetical protein